MEAIRYSKISANFYRITGLHIPDDRFSVITSVRTSLLMPLGLEFYEYIGNLYTETFERVRSPAVIYGRSECEVGTGFITHTMK
jgi:hypothetical protein